MPLLLLSLLLLAGLLVASPTAIRCKVLMLSLLSLALSGWWLVNRLSGDGVNAATLYHLRTNLEGAGVADFSRDLAIFGLLASASLLLPVLLARFALRRDVRQGRAVMAGFALVFVATVAVSPLATDAWRVYQQLRPGDGTPVAAEYVVVEGPLRQPKNIVWIYGESLERTYLDPAVFPGLMPNIARLAGEGLDFRGIASPEGSGWTIAGLVASMCGVPLTTGRGDENSMGRMDRFLPGAHCLGDYLKQQGYANHFIGGANAAFAAKGAFLASHGFDSVEDVASFRARGVAEAHFSNWGVHDDVLLDEAWARFQALSQAGTPFLLTALTMDTHHPAGHLPVACKDVRYDSAYGDIGLLRALKCSDRLIARLVDRIRGSAHAADTLIVIASDHLAMPNDLSHVLARQKRENLLLFLGADLPPREVARAGSTLDSGATLLQLLDAGKDALGFGRSLLAPRPGASASMAALAGDGRGYAPYLSYARTLWVGNEVRTLRIDADRITVGEQRVTPPVMLEYDPQWSIKAIFLEDAPRQFERSDPDNLLAYVDRCTAFEDASEHGEWCALLVDRDNNLTLHDDAALRQGVRVDAPLGAHAGLRPRPRRPLTLSRETRPLDAGNYQVRLRTRSLPKHSFWLEAVSSQGKVVHARQWVQAGPEGRPERQIKLPVGLDQPIDELEIRVWLDYTEQMAVDRVAWVPVRRSRRDPAGGGD